MNNLVLVKESLFGSIVCDYYSNGKGEFFMTREQIGRALGYETPMDAIYRIHERHKDRLDQFSVIDKLTATDGKSYETYLYSVRGIYEICRWSNMPLADAFYDHVYDILEGLRLGYLKLTWEKQTPAWLNSRQQGKEVRRAEMDTVKRYVEYAKEQGSAHADNYYNRLSELANKAAGITDRDNATIQQLSYLAMVEQIINHCLQEGIGQQEPYKDIYQQCKRRLEEFRTVAMIA